MSADNASETPTTEQKGKENAPVDQPVQEDRFSLQDSTYGTGAAHPTPTTPLFPPPQEQNRQHQGVLTVVEEDEKLEHFPVEDATSRLPPTNTGSAVGVEAAAPHESLEDQSMDDADDEQSIATSVRAVPGRTTRFRPIDWERPNAQPSEDDREMSPTNMDVETYSTSRRSMSLSESASAETMASHQAIDENSDMLHSSDGLSALSGHGEAPADHGAEGDTRLSVHEETSPSLKRSSNATSSSPCKRNRSGRTGPSRRPPQRAPRQGATEHVWAGPEECLPNLLDATDPQSLYGIEDPFADNDNSGDPNSRVDSSNARSAAAHQQSVAMSDPQSLMSALNATPMAVTRSRSNAAFTRLSVTHSEIVRARSEERHKGLQENEIPPKARAKLGIQAPVRQVPNPADPTSHLPPAFAGQEQGSRQGKSKMRIEIPRRFKPPAPAEVAARGRRQSTPDSERPPVTETAILHEIPTGTSRSSRRIERWVLGENHPTNFHEDDEEQGLLQGTNDGTRDELQPFATREGYVNPATSEAPTSDEGKKKEKERKKTFWANCRRRGAQKLLRRKDKKDKKDKDKDKKP